MTNQAKNILIPNPGIFRTVFLYVGQGESALLIIPDGQNHKYVLIDSHMDSSYGGIDVVKLLKDLFEGTENSLDLYINTHPHKDHLGGIRDIYEGVGIKEVWHSGHKPGKDHDDAYQDLNFVMGKLGSNNVFCLKGSREDNKVDDNLKKIGDVDFNILAPADHVSEDIKGEKPEQRYKRIHEQCGVIRFKYGMNEKQIMFTGDADLEAWKTHITEYHSERLPSFLLSAVHHGSNTFFWESTDAKDDPFLDHLKNIDPKYVIISAPKQSESPHDHPHDEAMELYKNHVGEHGLFHLGAYRMSVIVDISPDGGIDIFPDDKLAKEYGGANEDEKQESNEGPYVMTRLDRKKMG